MRIKLLCIDNICINANDSFVVVFIITNGCAVGMNFNEHMVTVRVYVCTCAITRSAFQHLFFLPQFTCLPEKKRAFSTIYRTTLQK